MSDRPRGFSVEPFEREEGVRAGDERAVVVETEVAAAFVVVESELAFQLARETLDSPLEVVAVKRQSNGSATLPSGARRR